jgi:capsular polysaccharide biosynthesis protein
MAELAPGLRARSIARLQAFESRFDALRSFVPLSLTSMGQLPMVTDPENLLQRGATEFWEAYPPSTLPKHAGFRIELCHQMPAAPIPEWMLNDSGCSTPPVRFAGMDDAILWLFDGVALGENGDVIAESTFTLQERSQDLRAMSGTRKRGNQSLFRLRTVRNAPVIETPVLLAANGWYRAFGHWIYDTLTAVRTFIEPIRSGHLKVIFSEVTPWQRAWLTLLGVPEDAILEGGYGFVRARRAIIPSSLSIQNVRHPGMHTVALINFLRENCLKGEAKQNSFSPFLYLSRARQGAASHRTLVNEREISEALMKLGFLSIAPETLTATEQITLFAQARVIIGPVGSAFALSGLAGQRASIVEILPPPAAHSWMYRSSANFQQLYGCLMAEVLQDSCRDMKNKQISRPAWFYSYVADLEAVIRVARRAIELSGPSTPGSF